MTNFTNNNNNNLENIKKEAPVFGEDIKLSENEIEKLKEGLDKLKELSKEGKEEDILSEAKDSISSFSESFPNYSKTFERLDKIIDSSMNSEVLTKILGEKGLTEFLKIFKYDSLFNYDEKSKEKLNRCEEYINNTLNTEVEDKYFGELGDLTLNKLFKEGVKLIIPLNASLDSLGVNIGDVGFFISFLFMYRNICKGHAQILKKYDPYKDNYNKLSPRLQLKLQDRWIKSNNRFSLIAAPLLVTSLYVIKNAIYKDIKLSVESKVEILDNNSKQNYIGFLLFLKRLPNYIGKIVLIILSIALFKYLLQIYSIDLNNVYYIKILCIFSIIIISIFTLDYLLKYFLSIFFKKNKNLNISDEFPKLVYDYLNDIKILAELDESNNRFYLINFFIYITILVFFIIILIII